MLRIVHGVAKLSLGILFVVTYRDEAVFTLLSRIQDFHQWLWATLRRALVVPRGLVFA
jgi:hypothetical protein